MGVSMFWGVSFDIPGFQSLTMFSYNGYPILFLNINGARERNKLALLKECIEPKEINVMFLQETHNDPRNETDWGLWWDGESILSHGTNFSAEIAILF